MPMAVCGNCVCRHGCERNRSQPALGLCRGGAVGVASRASGSSSVALLGGSHARACGRLCLGAGHAGVHRPLRLSGRARVDHGRTPPGRGRFRRRTRLDGRRPRVSAGRVRCVPCVQHLLVWQRSGARSDARRLEVLRATSSCSPSSNHPLRSTGSTTTRSSPSRTAQSCAERLSTQKTRRSSWRP